MKFGFAMISLFSYSLLAATPGNPLKDIHITIDPGHGFSERYDFYRVGPTGEREEWINLRVAKLLAKKLKTAGADVWMTRDSDADISLGGRANLAKIHKSDLFISIHHNGSTDHSLDYPIVYFWGSAAENPASVDLARCLLSEMKKRMTFEQKNTGAVLSDYLIYPRGTSILRNTVDEMPAVIGEGGFFSCAKAELRMKDPAENEKEAEAYYQAIKTYLSGGIPKARPVPLDNKVISKGGIIQFQLTDGFAGHSFQESTFRVLQDKNSIPFKWNSEKGLMTIRPELTNQKKFSIRIFGTNEKGNAIHPRRWTFKTQFGKEWWTTQSWKEAFDQAENMLNLLTLSKKALPRQEMKIVLEDCIHLYKLSLANQAANPVAKECEQGLLTCYTLQETRLGLNTGEMIALQKKRLAEFYP